MKNTPWIQQCRYCTGCGLCSNEGVEGGFNEKGFYRPFDEYDFNNKFDKEICPYTSPDNNVLSYTKPLDIWGSLKECYLGWSNDEYIRHNASSGGILTSLSIYLIENKIVDGIIHIGISTKSQFKTEVTCSTTKADVLSKMGSRYTQSAPLLGIKKYLDNGGTYAFIGKPCDVIALRNYISKNGKYKNSIKYMFSFFCAGTPSIQANERLIKSLGTKEENVVSFTYRGNGWPGLTCAIDNKGNDHTMLYKEAWGGILGRDLQEVCRFCWDGTGESADISCGDAWYLTPDKKPDFTEGKGRNVIMVRNEKGSELLSNVMKAGIISAEDFMDNIEDLKYMQYSQHTRKATMLAKIIALKLCGKIPPAYSLSKVYPYSKLVPLKRNVRIFWGTLKRALKGTL